MTEINRRQFLERAAILGASLSAGALLVACKSGGGASALNCDDTSGMEADQIALRTNNAYVEASPDAAKNCANCSLYTVAAAGACGGCTVIPGPINPAGYCNIWVAA